MTREPEEPPYGLLDKRTMVTELERLAVHFPRTDMDERKWGFLYDAFWNDCQHLTADRFRTLCRAYRAKPENRFFPTPGQLLESAHHPFEDVYITPQSEYYRALPEPKLSDEELERRCKVLTDLAAKLCVRERVTEPLVMTTELELREKNRPYDLASLAAKKAKRDPELNR